MKLARKITKSENIKDKVKAATSNKQWGPTGSQMAELATASFNFQDFNVIMRAIWKRLNDHGKNWRHIYKSLLVLDYLIKNGSAQVINDARVHLPNIQTLTTYTHIDTKNDKDVGESVRERSRAIIELLNDEERLRAERSKAKSTRSKFGDHMSSDGVGYASRRSEEPDEYSSSPRSSSPRSPSQRPQRSRRTYRENGSDDDDEYDSDEGDLPKPEPLPSEWLEGGAVEVRNKREVAHLYEKPKKAPKAPSESGSTSSYDSDVQPPDTQDKASKLREMFPELSSDGAIAVLMDNNYSISDSALRLSDPKTMARYGLKPPQQQQQQQPQLKSQPPTTPSQPSLIDLWDLNVLNNAGAGSSASGSLTVSHSTPSVQAGGSFGGSVAPPTNWTTFQQGGAGSSSSFGTLPQQGGAPPTSYPAAPAPTQPVQPFQQLQQQQLFLEQQRQQLLYQQWLLQQQQQGLQFGQQPPAPTSAATPTLGGMVLSGGISSPPPSNDPTKPDPFADLVLIPRSPPQQPKTAPPMSAYMGGSSQQSTFFSSSGLGPAPPSPPSSFGQPSFNQPTTGNPFFA